MKFTTLQKEYSQGIQVLANYYYSFASVSYPNAVRDLLYMPKRGFHRHLGVLAS
jgi:hypothetical protein